MSDTELAFITQSGRNAEHILEIGSYCGRSTQALLLGTSAHLHVVEPFERIPSPGPAIGQPDTDQRREYMSDLAFTYRDRLTIYPCLSDELRGLFCHDVGLLLIDGDHSYEAVKNDIELWAPRVRGWLMLDDYNGIGYPGVREAAREMLPPPSAEVGKIAGFRINA